MTLPEPIPTFFKKDFGLDLKMLGRVELLKSGCWLLETMSQCTRWPKHSISCPHQVCNVSRCLAAMQFSFLGFQYKRIGAGPAPMLQLSHLDWVSSTLFVSPLWSHAAGILKWVQWYLGVNLTNLQCSLYRGSLATSRSASNSPTEKAEKGPELNHTSVSLIRVPYLGGNINRNSYLVQFWTN